MLARFEQPYGEVSEPTVSQYSHDTGSESFDEGEISSENEMFDESKS